MTVGILMGIGSSFVARDLMLAMLLLVLITLIVTLMTAWSAAQEKPLNVLRYA